LGSDPVSKGDRATLRSLAEALSSSSRPSCCSQTARRAAPQALPGVPVVHRAAPTPLRAAPACQIRLMDAETKRLAERQHGLLLASQMRMRGSDPATLRSWVARRDLIH